MRTLLAVLALSVAVSVSALAQSSGSAGVTSAATNAAMGVGNYTSGIGVEAARQPAGRVVDAAGEDVVKAVVSPEVRAPSASLEGRAAVGAAVNSRR